MNRYLKLFILILVPTVSFCFQSCDSYHTEYALDMSSNGDSSFSSDFALQSQALQIIENRCGDCHVSASLGGVYNITVPSHLYATGLIVPGDPTKGRLILSIQEGSMPEGGFMGQGELQIIKDWVASMIVASNKSQLNDISIKIEHPNDVGGSL